MFKKIALVAMLAAGSLQAASWTDSTVEFVKAIPSHVKNATLSQYCLNADRKMSLDMSQENAAAVTLNTVNAVSRVALLTKVIRASLAARKANAGKKMEAAKEVLTNKVTIAALAAAVLAVLVPQGYTWATKKNADGEGNSL